MVSSRPMRAAQECEKRPFGTATEEGRGPFRSVRYASQKLENISIPRDLPPRAIMAILTECWLTPEAGRKRLVTISAVGLQGRPNRHRSLHY